MKKEIEGVIAHAPRLRNDSWGNPRVYVSLPQVARLAGIEELGEAKRLAKKARLPAYRGKRFGTGYALQSYYAAGDLCHFVARIRAFHNAHVQGGEE